MKYAIVSFGAILITLIYEGGAKIFKEIKVEMSPNLMKTVNPRGSTKVNHERYEERHIIVKLLKTRDKKKICKAARDRHVIYKGIKIWMTADFSLETM